MSTACSRYTIVELSNVQATAYSVLVDRSITVQLRLQRLPTKFKLTEKENWTIGTGVAPTRLAILIFHSGAPPASASKAYSVSLIVATYKTLWVAWLMMTLSTYSGCAKIESSTGSLKTSPKVLGATLEVFRVVSLSVAPDTPLSYPRCSIGG